MRRLNVARFHRAATHYGVVSFDRVADDARRRQLWIGHGTASRFIRVYRTANPMTLSFLYKDASFVDRSDQAPATSPAALGGVNYETARSRGWIEYGRSGEPMSNGYPPYVMADIGNRGYQRAWARNVIAQGRREGWSGVFADDLGLSRPDVTPVPQGFESAASWRRAVGSFLAGVGPQLHAHRLRLIANMSGGVHAPAVRTELLRYVDGTMEEGWMRPTTRQSEPLAGGCVWRRQLAEELTSESHGKLFLAELPADVSDTHAITYGLATFLLGADGDASFDVEGNPHYAKAVWVPEFETARRLGLPHGALTIGSAGLYRRDFARGTVLVNPTAGAITARLRGRYSGSGYSDVTGLTLGPTSGIILLRQR